jgi:hypothetical protein
MLVNPHKDGSLGEFWLQRGIGRLWEEYES